jgi:2-hydroxychromene-2-carboxylate isomerase
MTSRFFEAHSSLPGSISEKLMARAQQDEVKKKLIELTTDAVNRGAFGSPTFFVGREMFFGKDQLRDVEEAIVEQTSHVVSKTA